MAPTLSATSTAGAPPWYVSRTTLAVRSRVIGAASAELNRRLRNAAIPNAMTKLSSIAR